MRQPILTSADKAYIRRNRLKLSAKAMARQIGCSNTSVLRFLRKEGITPPKNLIYKMVSETLMGRTSFTKEEDQFIRENYLKIPVKVLGEKMGRSFTGTMNRLKLMGLAIPDDVKKRNIQAGRIQKGDSPFNKGKKQVDYMSPAGIRRSAKTRFKKGHVSPNTKRDGYITVRNLDGKNGDPAYKYIRLSKNNWVPLHQYRWEKKHGKVKRGQCLWFKDGDTLNCRLSNLELITRAENMRRNSIHNYPAEIKQAIHTLAVYNRKLNKIIKNENYQ